MSDTPILAPILPESPETVTPPDFRRPTSRMSVVETVYYQRGEDQPVGFQSIFSRDLETRESHVSREVVLGKEWQPIDAGWLKDASMLVIRNTEGETIQKIMTAEEKAALLLRTVEVGIAHQDEVKAEEKNQRTMWSVTISHRVEKVQTCWVIRPTESLRGVPADLGSLRLRCIGGKATCVVTVIPSEG